MKNYVKPNLNIVELSVKESIALTVQKGTRTFGFGSNANKYSNITATIATLAASDQVQG